MLDVREILKALDPQDRVLWSQHRVEMRRSYLNAHNTTVGIVKWDMQDDMLLDLIDIKLALLFDRAGRFDSVKGVAGASDSTEVEGELHRMVDKLKSNVSNQITPKAATFSEGASAATAMMRNGWREATLTN